MPKILINEIDQTTPGTPAGYANYSVLIAGFDGNGDHTTVKPDDNGVYEFSSYQDFVDAIGVVEPDIDEKNISVSHYGNRMARELLKQGYTVIYLPIKPEDCANVLTNENTWEIFKDKANYDFRFIHHGLLESTDASKYKDKDDRIESLKNTLQALHNKNAIVFDADALTVKITTDADKDGKTTTVSPNQDLENIITAQENYENYISELTERGVVDQNLLKPKVEGEEADGGETEQYYESLVDAAIALATALNAAVEDKKSFVIVTKDTINDANRCIANLAKYATEDSTDTLPGRGDCIALIELDENSYTNNASADKPEAQIRGAIQELSTKIGNMGGCGKYCALTVPSVYYNDGRKFPGGFHYLSCFMNSLRQGFKEWYAAAGYTRGTSSYVIENTSVKLGEIAINALEPRQKQVDGQFACNVIANFRGSYYLWGNRTAQPLDDADLTASSFLNIRQLCTTIKKQLYVACRKFTFDPNSDTLWFNFVNAIKPTLEAMKADQGVRDYKIMKVTTDKKATLKAKIRIIPIEAVEDFDLTVSLEDSFGETTAVVTE